MDTRVDKGFPPCFLLWVFKHNDQIHKRNDNYNDFPKQYVLLFGITQCNEHLSLYNFDMNHKSWCFFVI